MSKRQSFVVIVEIGEFEKRVFGPYRSFKRADGDARAVEGYCIPIESVDDLESASDYQRRKERERNGEA